MTLLADGIARADGRGVAPRFEAAVIATVGFAVLIATIETWAADRGRDDLVALLDSGFSSSSSHCRRGRMNSSIAAAAGGAQFCRRSARGTPERRTNALEATRAARGVRAFCGAARAGTAARSAAGAVARTPSSGCPPATSTPLGRRAAGLCSADASRRPAPPAGEALIAFVATTPILGATLAHWTAVAGRAAAPHGKASAKATSEAPLANQALSFLISSDWVLGEARALASAAPRRRYDGRTTGFARASFASAASFMRSCAAAARRLPTCCSASAWT